jgi:hypothetical protein
MRQFKGSLKNELIPWREQACPICGEVTELVCR